MESRLAVANVSCLGANGMKGFERVEQRETGFDKLTDEYFYSSMPDDVEWYASQCSLSQVSNLYHRCNAYAALSGNTGRITESARLVIQGDHEDLNAKEQASRIRTFIDHFEEKKVESLILCTNDIDNGPYNIIDGNCRAVAIEILNQKQENFIKSMPVYIALSRTAMIRNWSAPNDG